MVRWIVAGSVKFRLIVLTIAAAVLVAGPVQLSKAPVEALPEFMPPYVEVQTEALGLSSAEVEQLITVPWRRPAQRGGRVEDIRSSPSPGCRRSSCFEPGTDLFRARLAVQERLAQAHALPQVSKPPQMLQPVSSTGRT